MKRKIIGSILTLCMFVGMQGTAFAADGAKAAQPPREDVAEETAVLSQDSGESEKTEMPGVQKPGESENPKDPKQVGEPENLGESEKPKESQGPKLSGELRKTKEQQKTAASGELENPEDPTQPGESENPEDPKQPEEPEIPEDPENPVTPEEPEEPDYTVVPKPTTSKASAKSIRISWDSSQDDCVDTYYVMRRGTKDNEGRGAWKTIAKVKSDKEADGPKNSYTDKLRSSKIQQYEYKICTLSEDQTVDTREEAYAEETDVYAALGTNIKICIDPGHYESLNNNYDWDGEDGKYPYSEGAFTLKIGKALKKELKEIYGIDSYMTRTTERISLTYRGKTYVNENLDQGSVSVRGRMAKKKDCDFFISLHTNSTSSPKKIWSQPKSVNKVYIFVNQKAHRSAQWMKAANAIGESLTEYNQEFGIQTAGFTKRTKNHAALFTNLANDEPDGNGTVVYRMNSRGGDYYGVLRGSHEDGVPGILVEHAFHATKAMRKLAGASSELYKSWAECDAYGIARGFGLAEAW